MAVFINSIAMYVYITMPHKNSMQLYKGTAKKSRISSIIESHLHNMNGENKE